MMIVSGVIFLYAMGLLLYLGVFKPILLPREKDKPRRLSPEAARRAAEGQEPAELSPYLAEAWLELERDCPRPCGNQHLETNAEYIHRLTAPSDEQRRREMLSWLPIDVPLGEKDRIETLPHLYRSPFVGHEDEYVVTHRGQTIGGNTGPSFQLYWRWR